MNFPEIIILESWSGNREGKSRWIWNLKLYLCAVFRLWRKPRQLQGKESWEWDRQAGFPWVRNSHPGTVQSPPSAVFLPLKQLIQVLCKSKGAQQPLQGKFHSGRMCTSTSAALKMKFKKELMKPKGNRQETPSRLCSLWSQPKFPMLQILL